MTFSNIAVMLLAFVVLGGGAYAASSLGRNAVKGKSIARNAITSPKVKDHSLRAADFADGQVPAGPQGPPGADGSTGPAGPPGETGETGAPGVNGTARAYGLVALDGTLTKSKGIAAVGNASEGQFCIVLDPEIDSTSAVALVTPDFETDSTTFGTDGAQAFAEWDSAGCGDGSLEVVTGFREVHAGTGGFVNDVRMVSRNQGFSIVVP